MGNLRFDPAAPAPAASASSTSGGSSGERKFEHVPKDTVLDVEVVRCEERTIDKAKTPWKKFDEEVVFAFKVIDGDYKNRWFWLDVPAILDNSPNCKLRLYLQSILNVPDLSDAFPGGLDFDGADYIGQECQIRVGTYFSDKKQEIQNSVEDVLPAARGGGSAIPAAEAF